MERSANATTDLVARAARPFDAVSSELPTPNGHDFSQVGVLRSDQPAPEQAEHVQRARGRGSSLDPAIRQPLESVFRADFSQVSVHTDSEADDLAGSLNARAFTTGEDIYFNASAYDPSSSRGRELIAHELTHVVQQRSSGPPGGELDVSEPGDVAEQAADTIARGVVSGSSASARAPAAVDTPSIQRTVLDDVKLDVTDAVHDVAEAVGVESTEEADAARLQAFIDHGTFGPQSLVPPTNIGGFDASFDPTSNLLLIQVRTGVNFVNGLEIDDSDVITANHDDLAQAAADGNNLAPEDRPAFVDLFTWQPDLQDAFMAQLQARVREAWSGQFLFLCTHPGFESMFASVAVEVDVHESAAGPSDHLNTTTFKVPDGGKYNVGAFVQSNDEEDPNDNELVMSSKHVQETPLDRSLLRKSVFFDNDSAVIGPNGQKRLKAFERDFQDANLDLTNPVELVGHASSPGTEEYNEKLAHKRIGAVRDFLAGIGFTGINERVSTDNEGEEGATEDAEWRRVDLIVGSGEGQLVAAHEFGHVFGLGDEYVSKDKNPGGSISGSGSAVGAAVAHDALAKAIGTSGAIAENNDDIMSLGNTVRPKHYATFGWALAQLTGMDEWVVA